MVYKAGAYWVGMGFFSSLLCRLAALIARHPLDDQPAKSTIFWPRGVVAGRDISSDFCRCDLVIRMQNLHKNNVASEVKTRQKVVKALASVKGNARSACAVTNNRNVWVIHENFEPLFNAVLTSTAVILC